MTRKHFNYRFLLSTCVTLVGGAAIVVGCSSSDAEPQESEAVAQSEAAYTAAIPDYATVRLAFQNEEVAGQGSSGASDNTSNASQLRTQAQRATGEVNAQLEALHARLGAMTGDAQGKQVEIDRMTCRRWEQAQQGSQWRLTSCQVDSQRYGFKLEAKKEGENDNAYRAVVTGEGNALAKHEGAKCGQGRVGYDLDQVAHVQGGELGGQIGLGYRAAGPVRQVNLVAVRLRSGQGSQERNGVMRMVLSKGQGGQLQFGFEGDIVRGQDGNVQAEPDGVPERVRVTLTWGAQSGGRATASACEGSVGAGTCVAVHECWNGGGDATFGKLDANAGLAPEWPSEQCESAAFGADAAPSDADLAMPDNSDAKTNCLYAAEPGPHEMESGHETEQGGAGGGSQGAGGATQAGGVQGNP